MITFQSFFALMMAASFFFSVVGAVENKWLYFAKSKEQLQRWRLDSDIKDYFKASGTVTTILDDSTFSRKIEYWVIVVADDSQIDHAPKSITAGGTFRRNKQIAQNCRFSYGEDFNKTVLINSTSTSTESLGTTLIQKDAPQDLIMVSWPEDQPFRGTREGLPYYYPQKSFFAVTSYIYVIDNGVDARHTEFGGLDQEPEWIIADGTDPSHTDDGNGHGTCVASKALGRKCGVIKNSRLVIVKTAFSMESLVNAWLKVRGDIVRKGRQKRAVVVFAAASNDRFLNYEQYLLQGAAEWYQIEGYMDDLRRLGVPVVVAAGNYRARTVQVNTVPGLFAGAQHSSVIAVSAVDLLGEVTSFTQEPLRPSPFNLWAPGQDIYCAESGTTFGYSWDKGTSFAAPMVAGLVADFLSQWRPLPCREATSRSALYLHHLSRSLGSRYNSPPIIWNGNERHYAIENNLTTANSSVPEVLETAFATS